MVADCPESVVLVGDSIGARSAEEDIRGVLRATSMDVVEFDAAENRRTDKSLDDRHRRVEAVAELKIRATQTLGHRTRHERRRGSGVA